MNRSALSDKALLPASEGAPSALPYYRGKGEHTVQELEMLCAKYREYCRQQGLIKAELVERVWPTDQDMPAAAEFREAAKDFVEAGDLELDDNSIVSFSDEGDDTRGAYVQMWKWVEIKKTKVEGQA